MRGARHRRSAQGRSAMRLRRAESRRDKIARRSGERNRRAGARQDRPGRGVQTGDHRAAIAEDAIRENPARHHQEDGRRRSVDHAGDHRGPEGARRDRCRA